MSEASPVMTKRLFVVWNTSTAGIPLREGGYRTEKNPGTSQTATSFLDCLQFPDAIEENTFWAGQLHDKEFKIDLSSFNELFFVIPPGSGLCGVENVKKHLTQLFDRLYVAYIDHNGVRFQSREALDHDKLQFAAQNFIKDFKFKTL